MGGRGPVKGTGGRPSSAAKRKAGTAAGHAAASKSKAAAKKKSASKKRTAELLTAAEVDLQFAESMADKTFELFLGELGRWKPLLAQDHLLITVLWDAVRQYRDAAAWINSHTPDDWSTTTDRGYEQLANQFVVQKQALKTILDIVPKFGLSPGDRVRHGETPTEQPKGSAFAAHMDRVRLLSDQTKAA